MNGVEQNRELLASEVAGNKPDINSFPAVMYLESQRGCPYDCIMCTVPKSYGRKPSEMPDEILEKLEPYFQYLELLAIHGNGEALLSKQIERYIDIANKSDSFLHCNTTGFPLTTRLNNKLVEAKLDLRFSIHAGTAKTYRRVMNDDFDRVLKKIDQLIELSAQKNRTENIFWFSCIVIKDNIDELDKFIEIAANLGIKQVRFMSLHPNKRTVFGTRRTPDEDRFIHFDQSNGSVFKQFNDMLPDLEKQAEKYGIELGAGSMKHHAKVNLDIRDTANRFSKKIADRNIFPLQLHKGDCVVPWTGQVQIEQNGDVGLCCAVKHNIGNLFENSFEEIWHGANMNVIRESFSDGISPRVCGFCRGIRTDEYAIPVNKRIDELRIDVKDVG